MVGYRKIVGMALLSGGLLAGLSQALSAATSSTLDILSNDRAGDGADTVDIGRITPIAKPAREAAKPPPGGNPLWSVPLSVLSATQARPIFSASRRPPPQAVVAPLEQVMAAPPPRPAEPERPALALIGAVVGDADAIAVFLDRATQKIVRLRQGDSHAGWVLSSVEGREVTLRKADRSEILALQRPEGAAGAPVSGVAGMPGLVMPTAAGVPVAGGAGFVPFVPRSTPKNGESDGL